MNLGDVLNFIANPLILLLIAIPVLIFVGIYVGIWLTHPRKNRVLQIDLESGRAIDFEVDKEDTINAYCKPVGTIPQQRFLKLHTPLNVIRNGPFKIQNYALWLGRKGTAYTKQVNPGTENIPFRQAIENVFGKALYDRIPNTPPDYVKDTIEKSEVNVTVQLSKEEPLTPIGPKGEKLPSISSDDYQSNRLQLFLNTYAHGVQKMSKAIGGGDALKIIFILGTGIAIGIVLSLIFKWGTPTVVEASQHIFTLSRVVS